MLFPRHATGGLFPPDLQYRNTSYPDLYCVFDYCWHWHHMRHSQLGTSILKVFKNGSQSVKVRDDDNWKMDEENGWDYLNVLKFPVMLQSYIKMESSNFCFNDSNSVVFWTKTVIPNSPPFCSSFLFELQIRSWCMKREVVWNWSSV